MRAADIMSRALVLVTPETRVADAARLMRDRNIGFLPVVNDVLQPTLMGVLTDRDLALRAVAHELPADTPVVEIMSGRPLCTARMDADVHDIVTDMEQRQIRRVPVIDPDGYVVGVLSQGDLARHLGPHEPALIEQLLERVSTPPVPVRYTDGPLFTSHLFPRSPGTP